MNSSLPMFADVQTLLETSRPRPRMAWLGLATVAGVLAILAVTMLSDRSAAAQDTVETVSSVLMILLLGVWSATNFLQVRAARMEQMRLEAAEELVQLRRWPQAALLLQSILSSPMRSPVGRLQALVCLCGVAARYHRFEDVSLITDHLMDDLPLEAGVAHMVKLTRAMAILRQDRLFDADRAIGDLRRWSQSDDSAGLALVELYRDIKTGHPAEALEIFASKRDLIRRQLGHRVADAYVLAARAYDLLGQTDNARAAYESATLLAPAVELHRRYPETSELAGKYAAAAYPAEALPAAAEVAA
jgi:tetratricopeptide (TPR) repeat protein